LKGAGLSPWEESQFDAEGKPRKSLRLVPLWFVLILREAVHPVLAILLLFQLTALLPFLALLAAIAHNDLLTSV